jgi:hypothetical protein
MRLRKLKFPIAVLEPRRLMGGKNAGLSRLSWFNVCEPDFFRRGGYADALIYDSKGNEYEVETIELHKLPLLSRIGIWVSLPLERLATAVYRLFGRKYRGPDFNDVARVDMILKKRRQLSFDEFCNELRNVALAHPEWWRRHSTQAEIQDLFKDSKTFVDAIHAIGVLDPPGKEKLPGRSSKVVDLR